jgi:hypothetical protein
MADEEKKEDEDAAPGEEEVSPKSKKPMFLGGGIIGMIAAAYIVSMVALPGDSKAPPFDGPFSVNLLEDAVQVNIGGPDYLNMKMPAIKYEAYNESYGAARLGDLVNQRDIRDELQRLGKRTTKDIIGTELGEEVFRQEAIEMLTPIVFPVHVGNMERADRPHVESGLSTGASIDRSTMRGGFKAHIIHLNTFKGEISLDDGPVILYDQAQGDMDLVKADLMLESESGQVIYVNVTELTPEYIGEINVGTFGRIIKLTFDSFITQ